MPLITLSNFKRFCNFSYDLPESGIVLLTGHSGSGKSTILDAITHCLYGNMRSPHTKGKKGAAVDFGRVSRSNSPNVLMIDGQTATQGQIDALMGMNEDQFILSSYTRQDMVGSLVSLTPAKLLLAIESVAVAADDVNSLSKACNEKLTKLKSMHESACAKLQTLDSIACHPPEPPIAPVVAPLEMNIEDAAARLEAIRSVEKESNYSMSTYQAELKQYENKQQEKAKAEKELASLVFVKVSGDVNELDARLQLLRQELEDNARAKMAKSCADMRRDLPNISLEDLEKKIKKKSAKIDEITEICAQISQSLALSKTQLECPHCFGKLVLKNQKLTAGEAVVDASEDELLEAKSAKEKKQVELKELLDLRDQMIAAKNVQDAFEARYGQLTNFDLMDDDWVRRDDSIVKQEIHDIQQNISHIRQMDKLQEQLLLKQKMLEKTIEAALVMVEPKKPKVVDYSAEIERLNRIIEMARLNKQAEDLFTVQLQAFARERERYEQHIDRIAEARDCVTKLEAEIGNFESLKDAIRSAQLDAIESTVEAINLHAGHYLSRFFPEVTVTIETSKELVSGETKRVANVHVDRQDGQRWSVDDLSGGERARVFLAFQMALGDILGSKLLLLDECFRGLDSDNRQIVAEFLRDVADKRLVIIAEHNAPSGLADIEISL